MHRNPDQVSSPPVTAPDLVEDSFVPGMRAEPVATFRVRAVLRDAPLPGELSPAAEMFCAVVTELEKGSGEPEIGTG